MNERIRLLAEQAGISVRGHYDETGSTPMELQKFAELIVKECADLRTEIELVGLHSEDCDQGVWEGLQMYQNQIRRHFNIK